LQRIQSWMKYATAVALVTGSVASLSGLVVVAVSRFGYLPPSLFFLQAHQRLLTSGSVAAGLPVEFWWFNGFIIYWYLIARLNPSTRDEVSAAVYVLSACGLLAIGIVAMRSGWACLTADLSAAAAVLLFILACVSPAPSLLAAGCSLVGAMSSGMWRGSIRRKLLLGLYLATVVIVTQSWKVAEAKVEKQDASDANLVRWYESQLAESERPRDHVDLVAFTDYQCPYCARDIPVAADLVRETNRERPATMRMEIRDLPLDTACNPFIKRSVHSLACEAAAAVRLVNTREGSDAAVEMSTWLYRESRGLSVERLYDRLREKGLFDDFTAERDSLLATISADVAQAVSIGVRVTPTFIVNGVRLPGGTRPLRAVVAAEIARMGSK
jgi:protein-disulfide isomerase